MRKRLGLSFYGLVVLVLCLENGLEAWIRRSDGIWGAGHVRTTRPGTPTNSALCSRRGPWRQSLAKNVFWRSRSSCLHDRPNATLQAATPARSLSNVANRLSSAGTTYFSKDATLVETKDNRGKVFPWAARNAQTRRVGGGYRCPSHVVATERYGLTVVGLALSEVCLRRQYVYARGNRTGTHRWLLLRAALRLGSSAGQSAVRPEPPGGCGTRPDTSGAGALGDDSSRLPR